MKVRELRDYCREHNIKGFSGKRKNELIALIQSNSSSSSSFNPNIPSSTTRQDNGATKKKKKTITKKSLGKSSSNDMIKFICGFVEQKNNEQISVQMVRHVCNGVVAYLTSQLYDEPTSHHQGVEDGEKGDEIDTPPPLSPPSRHTRSIPSQQQEQHGGGPMYHNEKDLPVVESIKIRRSSICSNHTNHTNHTNNTVNSIRHSDFYTEVRDEDEMDESSLET